MESAKLSKKELRDLIFYSLKENNIEIANVKRSEIESILADYCKFCNYFQVAYVRGELDTFKRAACLLVAINRGRLSRDKRTNAFIALDAAYKMCEKPYWNVGEHYDIPKKLEEVDFKKAFKNDMETYTQSKNMLIDSLIYCENGSALSYYLNLELFYQIALQLKHNPIKLPNARKQKELIQEGTVNSESIEIPKKKTRLRSLFK